MGLLEGCHVHACQLALRRLERAYEGFFRRCEQGAGRKGFPRFKAARRWRSFQLKEHGNGWRLDPEMTEDQARDGVGVVMGKAVGPSGDYAQGGVGQEPSQPPPDSDRADRVVAAPQQQRWHGQGSDLHL